MADIVISGNTSGSVTLRAPDIAGSPILTLPTTSGTIVTTAGATSLTTSGNLTFTGTGNRILGDFSNATVANRVAFQTSTTNSETSVFIAPNGTSTTAALRVVNDSALANYASMGIAVTNTATLIQSGQLGSGSFLPLAIQTGGSERLRIDTSGNVGIGLSSPTYRLQVAPGTYSDQLAVFNEAGTWTSNGGVVIADYYDNTTLIGGIKISASTATSGFLSFHTGGTTERMRITSGGQVLINTTSGTMGGTGKSPFLRIATSTSVALGLEVAGTGDSNQIVFNNGNGEVGAINTSGTSTSYNTSSDYRLKENIAPMQNALGVVQQLKPVTYKWKVDGSAGQGFIAHELQAVVPDAVTGEKDAVDEKGNPKYQGVDTSFLVATLTAAIQELNAKVEAQAAEIAALKGVN